MFVKAFQSFFFVVKTTTVEFYRYQNYETANHASDGKQDQQIRHTQGLRCLIKKRERSNVTSPPLLCTHSPTISLQSYYLLPQDLKSAPLQRLF